MFKFAVLALLVVSASALPRRLPKPRLTDKRIVGGVDATQGEFPEQVSVHIFGSHSCGGSLISENAVLTAAHCCVFSPSDYLVVAGEHRLNGNDGTEEERDVSEVRQHEDYDSFALTDDVCILMLSSPINEADGITFSKLSEQMEPEDLEALVVTGWGTTSEGGNLANTLQKVEVPYVPNDRCNEAYQPSGYDVTDGMLCAGKEGVGGVDACQGDSGGPIFYVKDRTQVGLTSWGIGCARPDYPGVYTRTPYYNDWIAANMMP